MWEYSNSKCWNILKTYMPSRKEGTTVSCAWELRCFYWPHCFPLKIYMMPDTQNFTVYIKQLS